jgi:hypothetical protein
MSVTINELPHNWYVLYRTEEEFDTLKRIFDRNWAYYEGTCYGYTNVDIDRHWIDLSPENEDRSRSHIQLYDIVQITYEEFEVFVLGKPDPRIFMGPSIECLYLKPLFQQLNIQ